MGQKSIFKFSNELSVFNINLNLNSFHLVAINKAKTLQEYSLVQTEYSTIISIISQVKSPLFI